MGLVTKFEIGGYQCLYQNQYANVYSIRLTTR
jgi:hypothetical protein